MLSFAWPFYYKDEMTLSINEFKAKINPAPANKYNIIINNKRLNGTPYHFTAREVTIPGQNINSTTFNIQGLNINVGSNLDFDNISITFISDVDLKVYKAIEEWQSDIYNKQEFFNYFYDDYVSDIFIEVLDKKGKVVLKIKVMNAWPKTIPDISLGWDNNDQVIEFTVSFDFYRWDVVN